MDITQYVDSVKDGVQNAAALGDEHTREVAGRLGVSVESASRLALLQAVTDAAAEISVELAPGSVEVRMSGPEPTFVVTLPPAEGDGTPTVLGAPEDAPPVDLGDPDDQQARVSLRLPQSVKEKVDEYAAADGVSTNTWLLHRVLEALADRTRGGRGRGQGWGINIGNDGVRLNLPPSVPMPPMPPMPPGPRVFRGGPFGAPGAREDRGGDGPNRGPGPRHEQDRRGRRGEGSGPVQGWVR